MPTNYPGSESGITTDRADIVVPIPVDGDPGNASTFNNSFQPIINFLQRVRKKAGFLDVASSWTALQTFAAGFAGTTAALTGAITAGSVNTGSGPISGGTVTGAVVNGTDGNFINISVAALTAPNVLGSMAVAGTLSGTVIAAGSWLSPGGVGSGTFAAGWSNGTPGLSFRLTPWGELVFRGVAVIGTGGTPPILTLPATHRPSVDRFGLISATNQGARQECHVKIEAGTGVVSVVQANLGMGDNFYFDSLRISI